MLSLNRLRVSLTKHGAHKIAILLKKYDKDIILDQLQGVEPGINISTSQAKKNLSVTGAGEVPEVWNKARVAGSESIEGLVFFGVILSHHRLIEAMRAGRTAPLRGYIKCGEVLDGKEFTNFACIIEELGYSVSHAPDHVSYNLERLFEIPGLNSLVLELAAIKLKVAGWDGKESLIEEILDSKINEVFSVSAEQFENWLVAGRLAAIGQELEDEAFFLDASGHTGAGNAFAFKAGHAAKKTGTVDVTAATNGGKAHLLHNELQTALYNTLARQHGEDCVGTELDSGSGTSIDLVVKTATFCWFYEIKVATSLKACFRQSIPQLLEYAYWREDAAVADRLYIAATFKLTLDAAAFLELLRTRFCLPVYYHQIELGQ